MLLKVTTRIQPEYGTPDPTETRLEFAEVNTKALAQTLLQAEYAQHTETLMGPVRGGESFGCYLATLTAVFELTEISELPDKPSYFSQLISADFLDEIFGHSIDCPEAMTWRYIESADGLPLFNLPVTAIV